MGTRRAFFVLFPSILAGCAAPLPKGTENDPGVGWVVHQAPNPDPSAAYKWMMILQEAGGRSVDRIGARPTVISREMAIAMTAMYDAWAAYDETAVGTRLGGKLRRPAAERTPENKSKAVAYAVYRALLSVYPEDAAWLAQQMRGEGHDPDDLSADLSTPQDIGNSAAAAEMAALSRMLGGYHIATDNNVGLAVGRKIAEYSWPGYRAYFEGTAKVRD